MQKTLRSLIHEKIPIDLRFKLELLSRNRSLVNKEKHEKIIELFREFDIKNLVLLGPGTNRYAVKIDGYVLKIATDHDGKIDNLKEFKMAKRLFPYVTKTYEVSENGTLLVAEYISPFSSYHEMTVYADKIREILTKLSSIYLIGDVGITPKNFANWGLRAGSDDPVCLDFAYVYEVSSELFICRECNTNSMLVPDRDFKRLNCSNPSCGKEYNFEDIRAKIGNDLHRHEIGDLKEEGYYMSSSNVVTVLDEQRSNYLVSKSKKKDKHQKSLENETEEDTTMSTNLENTMAIAKSIVGTNSMSLPIKAIAVPANGNLNGKKDLIPAVARLKDQDEDDILDDENLAFSGFMNEDDDFEIPNRSEDVDRPDVVQMPEEDNYEEDIEEIPIVKAVVTLPDDKTPDPSATVENYKSQRNAEDEINELFVKNMKIAVSKISNRISNCLHIDTQFDDVRSSIKGSIYPKEYYKNIQNAAFRALAELCNFKEEVVQTENSRHKEFIPPTEIIGTPYEDTVIFLARVWNNRDINTVEDPNMMDVYRSTYTDYLGIQREWIELFKKRLSRKMDITEYGLEKIVNAIVPVWCVPENEVEESEDDIEDFDDEEVIGVEEDINVTPSDIAETFISEIEDDESEDIVFSGEFTEVIDVIQSPIDNDDDEEEDDSDYEADEDQHLSVEIYHENDHDIVRINTEEFFGPISIPFYTRLADINGDEYTPSIADDRNGVWDWLIHMVPDMMFTTKDPTKWLKFNDVEEINQPHVVIMDEDKNEYTMGIYFVKGVFEINKDDVMVPVFDEDILKKINKLIRDDIGYSRISYLRRSLDSGDFIYNEEEILAILNKEDSDDVDDTDDSIEDAAISVLMNDTEDTAETESDNDEVESFTSEENVENEEEDKSKSVTTFKVMRRNQG